MLALISPNEACEQSELAESGRERNQKGLAALDTLFMLIFLFIFIFIFGALAMNNVVKQDELSITQRDTLIVKNTYSLFEKSLDSTWDFSTVQAIFASAENGFEPSVMFSEEAKDAYWYRFHPETAANIKLPNEVAQTLPTPNRCNQPGGNPGICLPQSANAENFLNRSMKEIWFKLSDSAPYQVLDKPVKISIANSSNNTLDIVTLRLWPAQDRVIYEIATHVIVEGFRSKINTYTISEGYIKTDLLKMIKIGWLAVSISTQLRWEATRPASSSNNYIYREDIRGFSEISSEVETFIKDKETDISNQIKNNPQNKFYMKIDPQIEFRIPESASSGIQPGSGLIIHYTADVSIDEGIKQLNIGPVSTLSGDCQLVNQYKKSYTSYEPFISATLDSPDFALDSITDSPQALVAAIITQESSWNPKATSSGAVGLMQLSPSTAKDLCKLDAYELTDPEKNIKCGIFVLSKYFQQIKQSIKQHGGDFSDKINIMKITLLSYNCGINCIRNEISTNGHTRYEDIYPTLPTIENQQYTEKVLSHMSKWQNCIGFGKPVLRNRILDSTLDINYKKGRQVSIDSIIIHACGDSYENCIQRYQGQAKEGMHYIISKKGEISQLVKDDDKAFHSNYYDDRSIGISLESSGPSTTSDWTNELKTSLINLVKYLSVKYAIEKIHIPDNAPASCCDSSCGLNAKGMLEYSQICPSNAINVNGFPWTDFIDSIRKLPPQENPVLAITNSCSSTQDVGKYLCQKETNRYALYKCSYSTDYTTQRAELTDLIPLGIEPPYPCFRSDCSDCTNKILQNTVQDIEDYRLYLQKNSHATVFLNDNYCEDIDDTTLGPLSTAIHDRGDNHLAYDLTLQQNKPVYSAYAGDVIYSVSSPTSYLGSCGGMVMVRTGNTIIAYSNIANIPASISNIDPAHAVPINKNSIIGTVAACNPSHVEIRLFKATFDIPTQANSKNICGNPTNCYTQTTGDLLAILQSAATGVPRPIPYWCSSIKWDKGSVYHETTIPLEERNIIYDEDDNVLKRKPLSLKFSLEDWLPTLNCQGNEGKRYSWLTEKDMLCQLGKLYSCDRNIPGIGSQKIAKDAFLGNYKCTTSKSSNDHKTKFCLASGIPESQSDGQFNFCCTYYSQNSFWNKPDNFCENDGHCSVEEQTTISTGERSCIVNSPSCLRDCCSC